MLLTGRENPNPLDGPGGHRLQEVLLLQRRVELWRGDVGGDVLRRATVLEPHQQRRESQPAVVQCVFIADTVGSWSGLRSNRLHVMGLRN